MMIMGIKADSYSIKKYLPGFVVGLVAVNLSLPLCMLMIDVFDIFTRIILNSFGGFNLGDMAIVRNIDAFLAADPNAIKGGIWPFTFGLAMIDIFMWFMVIPLVSMAAAYAVMVVGIWVLIAISPLAFIGFFILEIKGRTWDRWLNAFITLGTMPLKVMFIMGLVFKLNQVFVAGPSISSG